MKGSTGTPMQFKNVDPEIQTLTALKSMWTRWKLTTNWKKKVKIMKHIKREQTKLKRMRAKRQPKPTTDFGMFNWKAKQMGVDEAADSP